MKNAGIDLIWVVVKDIQQAIKFYTEVLNFKLHEYAKEYGWAELISADGAWLGLAQENAEFNMKAGTNAVIAISVPDIEEARAAIKSKGAKLLGDIMEVPGEVKLQTFVDPDGNMFQLCQKLK